MSITTIVGPMFSGKTTELIRLIDRHRISGKKCIIIKHVIDTRYDTDDSKNKKSYKIITHSEICYHKCPIIQTETLDEDLKKALIESYDVVGIDEGFFFKGICQFSNGLANSGINVIVSTINTSYKQELFKEIGELMSCSEKVIQLSAICMDCKDSDAVFTVRTVDNESDILVGGVDIYKAVCRRCLQSNTVC